MNPDDWKAFERDMDNMEYEMRKKQGIPHNMFDDFFGQNAARQRSAEEAEGAYNFHKYKFNYEYPDPEPTPEEVFIEVMTNSSDDRDAFEKLYQVVRLKLRPNIRCERLLMVGRQCFRLSKKRPRSDPNKVIEKVLSKDEVTVTTVVQISA